MGKFQYSNMDWEDLEEEAFKDSVKPKYKPKKKRKSYSEFNNNEKKYKIDKKNSSR
tara:strand:- start:420 stop:587 length:168 start_codon:yes stop_codon:yes gene_type:complete